MDRTLFFLPPSEPKWCPLLTMQSFISQFWLVSTSSQIMDPLILLRELIVTLFIMTQFVNRTFSLILQFAPIIQFLMVVFSAMYVFSPTKLSNPSWALAEKRSKKNFRESQLVFWAEFSLAELRPFMSEYLKKSAVVCSNDTILTGKNMQKNVIKSESCQRSWQQLNSLRILKEFKSSFQEIFKNPLRILTILGVDGFGFWYLLSLILWKTKYSFKKSTLNISIGMNLNAKLVMTQRR